MRQTEIKFKRRSREEEVMRGVVMTIVREACETAQLREVLWREDDDDILREILATRTDVSDIVDECDKVLKIGNIDSDSVTSLSLEDIDKKEVPQNVAGLVRMFDRKEIGRNVPNQKSILSFTGFRIRGPDSVPSENGSEISKSKSISKLIPNRKTKRGLQRRNSTQGGEGGHILRPVSKNSGTKRKREKENSDLNGCTGTPTGNSKYFAADELVCRKRARSIQPTIEKYVSKIERRTLIGRGSDTADVPANEVGVVNPSNKQI